MPKQLYAVLHLVTDSGITIERRTLKQATIAFSNGANGVFLIPAEGGMKPDIVVSCYNVVRKHFPKDFIGINFMLPPSKAIKYLPMDADAIWTDYGIGVKDNSKEVAEMTSQLRNNGWEGEVFGGFYFKGNNSKIPSASTLKVETKKMEEISDVLTTSGASTGVAIETDVIEKISKFATKSVCIASGVSVENVTEVLPYADRFIVGTGIEEDSGDPNVIEFYKEAGLPTAVEVGSLSPEKVAKLSEKISQFGKTQEADA